MFFVYDNHVTFFFFLVTLKYHFLKILLLIKDRNTMKSHFLQFFFIASVLLKKSRKYILNIVGGFLLQKYNLNIYIYFKKLCLFHLAI